MPGRQFVSSSTYRYGFNGKENDKETVGTGNGTQDYGMRIYNPALGKFLSVDPLTSKYAFLMPYQFASNRPIDGIDLDGGEHLKANIASDAFFAQIGMTFCDEVERDVYLKTNSFVHEGVTYVNLGFHVYQNNDGTYTKTASKSNTKVSEWIYTDIDLIGDKHVFVWGDKTVKGSKPFSNGPLPNNNNCVELAKNQAKANGAEPSNKAIVTIKGKNLDIAEDYINKQLENNKGVIVDLDYTNGDNVSLSGDSYGSDHTVYIYGRTTTPEGKKIWKTADNVSSNSDEVKGGRISKEKNGINLGGSYGPKATKVRINKL